LHDFKQKPETRLTAASLIGLLIGLGLCGCNPLIDSAKSRQPMKVVLEPAPIPMPIESARKIEQPVVESIKKPSEGDPVTTTLRIPANALCRGDTFEVSIDFDIPLFYEIQIRNALPPAVGTSIELRLPVGFEAVEDWDAPSAVRSESPGGHLVHVGSARFVRRVRIADQLTPGLYSISCSFRYQACNERQCLRPVDAWLQASLTIRD